ncbi:MAG TPA: DUF3224 domain-containing protein [Terriglobales bacterium]
MNVKFAIGFSAVCLYAFLTIGPAAQQTVAAQQNMTSDMRHTAKGSFDVKATPTQNASAESPFSERILDKQYHGDLEGSAKGQMLAWGTGAKGSTGVYIALEQVTGTLQGRKGTFVLQHSGSMLNGVPQLDVKVVPGSGTDQLAGIGGSMNIIIAPDGKHSYEFQYTLAPAP